MDRGREFDRSFRPTTIRVRGRFERISEAQRRGEEMPPIDVYRIGELHFVRDGHHRVAVARSQGLKVIDAYATEVLTRVGADRKIRLADLPLPAEARKRIHFKNSKGYAFLAEGVEAWAFRVMQARQEFMTRDEVAQAWFSEEYEPVVDMLAEAGIATEAVETDAYVAAVTLRYMLLNTHEWDEDVLERVRKEIQNPSWEDTQIRDLRRELK